MFVGLCLGCSLHLRVRPRCKLDLAVPNLHSGFLQETSYASSSRFSVHMLAHDHSLSLVGLCLGVLISP